MDCDGANASCDALSISTSMLSLDGLLLLQIDVVY